MSKRGISLLCFIAIVISLELPLILSFVWMTGDFSVHPFNAWPITEWLINYQAGFIRRGLPGELLLKFFGHDSVLRALYFGMFVSFALYVALFLLVYWRSGIRNGRVLLVAILIQGGIFHMGLSADFYTRKENLFIIFFAIQCLLYMQIQYAAKAHQKYWIFLYAFLLIAVSPVFVLIHEAYIFLSFPISALLLWVLMLEYPHLRYLRLVFAVLCFEVIFTFIICSYFHGDVLMSQVIWDSLPFSDRLLLSPAAPYSAFGAIGSLGWSLAQHLTTLYGVFSSGGIVVWIFFGVGNLFVLTYIFSALQSEISGGKQTQFFRWIFIALLVLIPMFVIACDWGRWIASISNQLILLMFAFWSSGLSRKPETSSFWASLGGRLSLGGGTAIFVACILYELVFKMPECCAYYSDIFMPIAAYWGLALQF